MSGTVRSLKQPSFIFIHPSLALSENAENGAVFGPSYLGTFILITDALSNRCLVTNTFEIDLLTYYEKLWKDLSMMEKRQGPGKVKKKKKKFNWESASKLKVFPDSKDVTECLQ